jgi:hypothetical protein
MNPHDCSRRRTMPSKSAAIPAKEPLRLTLSYAIEPPPTKNGVIVVTAGISDGITSTSAFLNPVASLLRLDTLSVTSSTSTRFRTRQHCGEWFLFGDGVLFQDGKMTPK